MKSGLSRRPAELRLSRSLRRSAVPVFEPHEVLERAPPVHDARLHAERPPGPDDLGIEWPAWITDLELDPALVDVDDLVLRTVELERELLALADEQHLPGVPVGV